MNHLGDLEGALKSFFKSLGLGNKLNCVYNGISEVYLLCGKLEKALVYSNVALEK